MGYSIKDSADVTFYDRETGQIIMTGGTLVVEGNVEVKDLKENESSD